MLKLNKYLRLTRSLPFGTAHRFRSGRNCPKDCPPSYECKQPEKDETDALLEYFTALNTPYVFEKKCPKDHRLYRNIFFFLCVPIVICDVINVFFMESTERKRPKFVEFSYMRIRKKPFPWDPDRTLFHNPRYNALPTGYEIEVSEDEEYDPFERDKK